MQHEGYFEGTNDNRCGSVTQTEDSERVESRISRRTDTTNTRTEQNSVDPLTGKRSKKRQQLLKI